jgi:O-acetyl-ADP-ribose deacetylase (regulator of RNase III)
VGDAVRTTAGNLPAHYVIHAAGMCLGGSVSEDALRRVTRRALEVAAESGCRTIAFPAIGTGVGGLGVQRCADIMLAEVGRFLETPSSIEEVRFVLFGEPTYRIFEMVHDAERIRRQMEKLGR